MKFGVGQSVRRVEDFRLLTGGGRYTDDLAFPGAAQAVVVRSPYAHARIAEIKVDAARAMPGVLDVITQAEVAAAGCRDIVTPTSLTNRDGTPLAKPRRPILADGVARHVGDAVAFIVAETLDQARDAAEALEIAYEGLDAAADPEVALAPGAPLVWPERPGNVALDWAQGDLAATDAAFAKAARVVEAKLINNRLVSNPMEPRIAVGRVLPDGRLELTTTSQGSHTLQAALAAILDWPADRIRVVTPDVGGGFGTKIFPYPEHPLVLLAAQRTGRTVKWVGERADSFQADAHGRDNVTTARLALDGDGRILGLKVETIANLGAYLSHYGPFVATAAGSGMLPGVYDIPAAYVRVIGAYTHTTPVDAYRGAGRPEAAYVIERLMDLAARELGIAATEFRRRNFIRPDQLPYRTAFGKTYDSGEFEALMDRARDLSDEAGFPARKAAAAAEGRLLGRGLAYYVEACGGGGDEGAEITVLADGRVEVAIGTQSNGQGHETAYAQIVAGRMGVDIDQVVVLQGDTDRVRSGKGTGGSRSLPVGGAALDTAAVTLIAEARKVAAHQLEAALEDVAFEDGRFRIVGSDRALSWGEVAARLAAGEAPDGFVGARLTAFETWRPPEATYPNGCHVCELSIAPETGAATVERYWVVDDFGDVINPLMLAGQVYGGVAQGVGQALMERCVYDPDTGQLMTGSFMDYQMPRAADFPDIVFETRNVRCRTNLLGIKGAGEAGAIGAPPAVISAVCDALGVAHVDMPATPEKLWRLAAARQPG